MSQNHLTLAFPLKSPADAKALPEMLYGAAAAAAPYYPPYGYPPPYYPYPYPPPY